MTPAVGSQVWVERRKWPDAPHYGIHGIVLGRDEHGTWVGSGRGEQLLMPDGREERTRLASVWCVPSDAWFLPHFLVGHPELDVYVDICTPAVWNERGSRVIDLDFDVVVWNDAHGGRIELVDEDEFEEHRVALRYPAHLVADARKAAFDVLARVEAGEPPFTRQAAEPWLDLLGDAEQRPA